MEQLNLPLHDPVGEEIFAAIVARRELSRQFMKSITDNILGVQPMTGIDIGALFTVKARYTYVQSSEDFELTEPYSESDVVRGCFGWHMDRNPWERARKICCGKGCCDHG